MNQQVIVLRNVFATTAARFLGNDLTFNGGLAFIKEAMTFKTKDAAEKFLQENTDFQRGYRVSAEWK